MRDRGPPPPAPGTAIGGIATLPSAARTRTVLAPTIAISGDVSSQFLSGLLLVAPCLPDGLEITVDGPLQSVPYVDLTVAVMRAFGAKVEVADDRRWFAVEPTGYQQISYDIEPDASAASYFLAAAALCGGSVTIDGLGSDSLQGDVRFAEVLRSCGADVELRPGSVTITGGALSGGVFDLADISDTAQTLAAIVPFASASATVEGIGFIRRKETDRIHAVVTELQRLGVGAAELDDGFVIEPGPVSPGTVQTYDDHRMAMCLSLAAFNPAGLPVRIQDPKCVAKTFPDYFEALF